MSFCACVRARARARKRRMKWKSVRRRRRRGSRRGNEVFEHLAAQHGILQWLLKHVLYNVELCDAPLRHTIGGRSFRFNKGSKKVGPASDDRKRRLVFCFLDAKSNFEPWARPPLRSPLLCAERISVSGSRQPQPLTDSISGSSSSIRPP